MPVPLVYRLVCLFPGQGGDEFAAKVGDVGDDAAPDQVGSGRETLVDVPAGLSLVVSSSSTSPAGVLTGVARGGWATTSSMRNFVYAAHAL